jgi:hypothetical protein
MLLEHIRMIPLVSFNPQAGGGGGATAESPVAEGGLHGGKPDPGEGAPRRI